MKIPKFYRENGIRIEDKGKYLEEVAYADAIEAFVVVCVDCIFINREKGAVYLAKRKSKPMSNWWFIGGRVHVGEEALDAISRCVKRETGLNISSERFEFLIMKRYLFKDRQQFPQNTPCDSLAYVFALDVTSDEIELASSSLDLDEYESVGLREFVDLSELYSAEVFESVIDVYKELF